jgi:hypothetical protein
MRQFSFLPALIILSLVAGAPRCVHATGNVLVPSIDNTPSTVPDLGLIPKANATTDQPKAASEPLMSKPVVPLPHPKADLKLPTTEDLVKTQVMKMPEYKPPVYSAPDAKSSLKINSVGTWSPMEIKVISDQLSIPGNRVGALCQPMITGVLLAQKSPATFVVDAELHTETKYDGRLMGVAISKGALCSSTIPLPQNKGMVFQVGDKFAVPLGDGTCPAPKNIETPHHLSIGTDSNGVLQCVYQ